jgi:predicted Zn-dependent protease
VATDSRRAHFENLAAFVQSGCKPGEGFVMALQGEQSDFVRLNKAKVRQAGHVDQLSLSLTLAEGQRHATAVRSLSGERHEDERRAGEALSELRARLPLLPEDPHLLLSDSSDSAVLPATEAPMPEAAVMVSELLDLAEGTDLVGIVSRGPIFAGLATSAGQRSWFERRTFHLDFSLYAAGDKAVKTAYAGTDWQHEALAAEMTRARQSLQVLKRAPIKLDPGRYRAFFTPTALGEIFDLLAWGGFSQKALQTRQSPLRRLIDGEAELSPMISVTENTEGGVGAPFQASGFLKPPRVPLIVQGQFAGALTSPRSAREYGLSHNGANAGEMPEALDVAPGELALDQALRSLGTGVYVSNLWYLNYSDRQACRMTGMTRFATLWVEGGEPVAPLSVMRFDDSLYRILGTHLEALTAERQLLLSGDTYGQRSTNSTRLPGALVRDFTFTL